ncbi:hypothetical protein PKHYL_27510 [Psychrobacter sp. KH172YL61]|nr:hypothetical protein PKHYL_27510 [Psychrobacter sp. KH172YL61]
MQHYPAGGVEAMIDDMVYRIGHVSFALDKTSGSANEVNTNNDLNIDLAAQRASSAVVLSSQKPDTKEWQALACFYFNDKVRDSTQSMLDTLKGLGIESVMLTGDPSPQALVMAESLGMQTAYNGLSPTDKVNHIQQLQSKGAVVLMVGDGINDAPVLAAADVSTLNCRCCRFGTSI